MAKLDRNAAHRTFQGIERMRQRIHAGKLHINLLAAAKAPAVVNESVKRGLSEVLDLAGVDADAVVDSSSGLREMTLEDGTPHVRLIYGIDVPKKRILVILGEPLDRAFYGDSVRFAERKWREYSASPSAHQAL